MFAGVRTSPGPKGTVPTMQTSSPVFQIASSSAGRGRRAPRPEVAVAADTRILIVDRDRGTGKSLTAMLRDNGFDEVRSVLSGARAVTVAQGFQPRIVFLDIDLPDMNAYDLARKLGNRTTQPALRLIALTANVDHPAREEARGAGFERFLVKPVSQIELDKVLRRTQSIT